MGDIIPFPVSRTRRPVRVKSEGTTESKPVVRTKKRRIVVVEKHDDKHRR